jgi:SAM-dependent methyltransferase
MAMTDADRIFTQDMSANYERLLGPAFFTPMAPFVADVVTASRPLSILETAAGTGILTRLLADRLPDSQIVATDLSQAMLDYGATVAQQPNIAWQQADAQDLPFDDGSFDVVVCQFGAMFFPDRVRGYQEARRVLRDGGRYVMAIWDRLDANDLTRVGARATEGFVGGPPTFVERVPHGYFDVERIHGDLAQAGFEAVDVTTASARPQANAADIAMGLGLGTPQLAEYDGDKGEVVSAITERLLAELGTGDGETVEGNTRALIVDAR